MEEPHLGHSAGEERNNSVPGLRSALIRTDSNGTDAVLSQSAQPATRFNAFNIEAWPTAINSVSPRVRCLILSFLPPTALRLACPVPKTIDKIQHIKYNTVNYIAYDVHSRAVSV